MFEGIFILCALTSAICAGLLFRGHYNGRSRLVFWTALCFVGLTLNNLVLLVDLLVFPHTDIAGPFWRNFLSAIAGSVLLAGLISEVA
jgi:hypothetical protein